MSPKLKLLVIETYYEKTDPMDHMETFFMSMLLHGAPDQIHCKAFLTTLKRIVENGIIGWYRIQY